MITKTETNQWRLHELPGYKGHWIFAFASSASTYHSGSKKVMLYNLKTWFVNSALKWVDGFGHEISPWAYTGSSLFGLSATIPLSTASYTLTYTKT